MLRTAALGAPLFLVLWFLLISMPAHGWAGQHCGAQGDWRSALVPDYWPPKVVKTSLLSLGRPCKRVPFSRACKRHDDCYDRRGATQKQCDRRFLADLRAECSRAYKSLLDTPHREACKGAAQGYYQAVAKYGGPAFAKAQAKHRAKQQVKPGSTVKKATPKF